MNRNNKKKDGNESYNLLQKWGLVVCAVLYGIYEYVKAIYVNLQNDLNKLIVVPIIYLFIDNQEMYCEKISSIPSTYWKENIGQCEQIINYIYTGYVLIAILILGILLLNFPTIYKLVKDLLNKTETNNEKPPPNPESSVNATATRKVNQLTNKANEEIVKIFELFLKSIEKIKQLPEEIISLIKLYKTEYKDIKKTLQTDIRKAKLRRAESLERIRSESVERN
jgi:hypothetical protein